MEEELAEPRRLRQFRNPLSPHLSEPGVGGCSMMSMSRTGSALKKSPVFQGYSITSRPLHPAL